MTEASIVLVRDVMSDGLLTIDGLATAAEAVRLMREHAVSSLCIERRDEHDEFGLVEVADIAAEVVAKNRAPDRVNIYEIMSKPVLSVPSDMLARHAVRLLMRFRLSRAVVTDNERRPVGVVTLRDLVLSHVGD